MTPKEKAIEWVDRCDTIDVLGEEHNGYIAQQCALIAVDEIIAQIEPSVSMDVISARIEYWQEVKQEIEKL